MKKVEARVEFDEEFGSYYFMFGDDYIWLDQFMKTKEKEKINFLPTGEMIILNKIDYDRKMIVYTKTGYYR